MATTIAISISLIVDGFLLLILGCNTEAQQIVETWRVEYNESRPHRFLGEKTPNEFAKGYKQPKTRPRLGIKKPVRSRVLHRPVELARITGHVLLAVGAISHV